MKFHVELKENEKKTYVFSELLSFVVAGARARSPAGRLERPAHSGAGHN